MDKLPPLPANTQTAKGAAIVKSSQGANATPVTTQSTGSVLPLSPQITASNTANSHHLTALLNELHQKPSLTIAVSDVEVIDSQALKRLQQINPQLSRQILMDPKAAANYLTKFARPGSQVPVLITLTNTRLQTGDQVSISLNQDKLVIKHSAMAVRTELTEHLRQALPKQTTISELIQKLQGLQKLPQELQNTLLTNNTQNTLQKITGMTLVKNEISLQNLKQAIENSGLFTENKLLHQKPINGDLRTLLSELQKNLHSDKSVSSLPRTETSLSQLLSIVGHVVNPIVNTNPQTSINSQELLSLLQLFGIKLPDGKSKNDHTVKDQLSQRIQQLIQNTYHKIHINQLRAVTTAETNNPDSLAGRVITTEVPLRWGEQILPLHLSVEQITDEEKNAHANQQEENRAEDTQKSKRWQINLSFELPHNEHLHTRLVLIENSVSATLWAESDTLFKKTQQYLNKFSTLLSDVGVNVEEVICLRGKCPMENLSIDYHLIDTKM